MAEMGTEGAGSASAVISEAEADRVFAEELSKDAPADGGAVKAGDGDSGKTAPEGGQASAKDDNKTGDGPGTGTEGDDEAATLAALGLSAEDLPEAVRKAVFPALKKSRTKYEADLARERAETERERKQREWWGKQNADLSRKLKEREAQDLAAKPITADDIKAFREKHKAIIDSLPEGARRLWADDDYVADKLATERIRKGQTEPDGGKGADVEPEGTQPQQMTEEQQKELARQAQESAAEIEKAGYKDFPKTYASDKFKTWIKARVDGEMEENIRLFGKDAPIQALSPSYVMFIQPNAGGHIKLLKAYGDYLEAEKAEGARRIEEQRRKEALGGLGELGGGAPTGTETDESIMNESEEAFQARRARAKGAGSRR